MTLTIGTNLNSLAAQRQLGLNASSLGTAIQRLSSGLRINSAKDDAAGLAISERFAAQITGVNQAARNSNDAISLAQTAEGALGSISSNLQRIRELAVQSANGTNSASDRAALQAEAAQLITEVDRVASQTEFNGSKLLDGTFNGQLFQVGANRQQTVAMTGMGSVRSDSLGIYNGIVGSAGDLGTITPGAAAALSITLNGPGTSFNLGNVATDASVIAAAINNSGVAGLSAVALASAIAPGVGQTSAGATAGTAVLTLNGVPINIEYTPGSSTATLAQRRADAIAAINAQSAATGIFAHDNYVVNGAPVIGLGSLDGRNIVRNFSAGTATGATALDFGFLGTGTFACDVEIAYHAPQGAAVTSVTIAGAGIAVTPAMSVLPTGTALRSVDISTIAGANVALNSIDAALNTVGYLRANLGALQNRFASAIGNLQTSAENMSASRSRIVDADFAQETANLSRAQILQQASTAMVAQANQAPQGVLSLLR